MIEHEARKKWCPMVRTGSTNRRVADKPGAIDGVHDETRCIASDCMMWRWRKDNSNRNFQSGFCGLAGSIEI